MYLVLGSIEALSDEGLHNQLYDARATGDSCTCRHQCSKFSLCGSDILYHTNGGLASDIVPVVFNILGFGFIGICTLAILVWSLFEVLVMRLRNIKRQINQ